MARSRGPADPLIDLSGSTLYVYLILLTSSKPLGVREVQRRAGFRSPNSARHHLERLVEKGYAIKTEEGYTVVKPKHSMITHLVYIRGLFLPKTLFNALFSTTALASYLVLGLFSRIDPVAATIMAALSIILWMDTIAWIRRLKAINRLLRRIGSG